MKLKEIMFVGEEDSEKGYTAQALGYSIFTEGDTLEELKENIKDALKCHFDKKELPEFIGIQQIEVSVWVSFRLLMLKQWRDYGRVL